MTDNPTDVNKVVTAVRNIFGRLKELSGEALYIAHAPLGMEYLGEGISFSQSQKGADISNCWIAKVPVEESKRTSSSHGMARATAVVQSLINILSSQYDSQEAAIQAALLTAGFHRHDPSRVLLLHSVQ